jgi:hypothetical protein
MYTGDADATDPVCSLAPTRGLIDAVIANVATAQVEADAKWVYRINPSNTPAVVTEPRA